MVRIDTVFTFRAEAIEIALGINALTINTVTGVTLISVVAQSALGKLGREAFLTRVVRVKHAFTFVASADGAILIPVALLAFFTEAVTVLSEGDALAVVTDAANTLIVCFASVAFCNVAVEAEAQGCWTDDALALVAIS